MSRMDSTAITRRLEAAETELRAALAAAPRGTYLHAMISFGIAGTFEARDSFRSGKTENESAPPTLAEQLQDVAHMADRMGCDDAAKWIRRNRD